jgi:hypothetical protein
MKDRLVVISENYNTVHRIQWYLSDENDYGAYLGDHAQTETDLP